MSDSQKEKLSWLLADLCATSVRLGKVLSPRSQMFFDLSAEQDLRFKRAMDFADEISQ